MPRNFHRVRALVCGLPISQKNLQFIASRYIFFFDEDVATPSDYDLPYEPLELKTEDNILLRCYLLPQKKDLGHFNHHLPIPDGMSEEEVSTCTFLRVLLTLGLLLFLRVLVYIDSTDHRHVPW